MDPTTIKDGNQIMLGTGFTAYGQQVATFIAGNLASGSATSATVGQSQVSNGAKSGTTMQLLEGAGLALARPAASKLM